MYLKKYYKENGELDYLSLAHTGVSREQHFSTSLITEYVTLGLMEIKGKTLLFNVYPEPLRYEIKREPGRYCLHCGEKLADDQGGELARLHIATKHKDAPPNANNPAGYENIHYFDCTLDEAQHEKYHLAPGTIVHSFPEKEG